MKDKKYPFLCPQCNTEFLAEFETVKAGNSITCGNCNENIELTRDTIDNLLIQTLIKAQGLLKRKRN